MRYHGLQGSSSIPSQASPVDTPDASLLASSPSSVFDVVYKHFTDQKCHKSREKYTTLWQISDSALANMMSSSCRKRLQHTQGIGPLEEKSMRPES